MGAMEVAAVWAPTLLEKPCLNVSVLCNDLLICLLLQAKWRKMSAAKPAAAITGQGANTMKLS